MAEIAVPAQGRAAQGYYKVVQGVPAAMVRSYKEPLYDSEQILSATPAIERTMFQKPVGQLLADGVTTKTFLHTNMTAAGMLGVPTAFDVFGFNLRLNKDITIADWRAIMLAGVVEVFFGQDTKFLVVPMEDMPSGVDAEGMSVTDQPHIGTGVSDNFYRFDINGKSIHINSTENFSVKISFPSGLTARTARAMVRFYIRGIKYKGV